MGSFQSDGIRPKFIGALLLLLLTPIARALSPECALHQPQLRVTRADIFTDEQEQWLGNAQADMVEPRYTLLTEAQSAYLNEIGKRLPESVVRGILRVKFEV